MDMLTFPFTLQGASKYLDVKDLAAVLATSRQGQKLIRGNEALAASLQHTVPGMHTCTLTGIQKFINSLRRLSRKVRASQAQGAVNLFCIHKILFRKAPPGYPLCVKSNVHAQPDIWEDYFASSDVNILKSLPNNASCNFTVRLVLSTSQKLAVVIRSDTEKPPISHFAVDLKICENDVLVLDMTDQLVQVNGPGTLGICHIKMTPKEQMKNTSMICALCVREEAPAPAQRGFRYSNLVNIDLPTRKRTP
mmetsp:Transcript_89422/g.164009  ORF Transcript_89422/g.164009 Transcript_89422/m.164009 type:complete len:250 (+) Transcript_89422:105-854(+)